MSFTIENEKPNKISFLDVQNIREDQTFTTSVYSTPTFSEVYTYFGSLLQSTFKFGNFYILAYKYLRICSSWTKLHTKLPKTNSLKKWLP